MTGAEHYREAEWMASRAQLGQRAKSVAAPETVGDRIRNRRLELGLSLIGLGAMVGKSESYISSIERGRRSGSPATVIAILDALGIAGDPE